MGWTANTPPVGCWPFPAIWGVIYLQYDSELEVGVRTAFVQKRRQLERPLRFFILPHIQRYPVSGRGRTNIMPTLSSLKKEHGSAKVPNDVITSRRRVTDVARTMCGCGRVEACSNGAMTFLAPPPCPRPRSPNPKHLSQSVFV